MATKKKKSKKPALGEKGHNSSGAEDDEEMRRIAKGQRSLDTEKDRIKAEWKERHDKLTARLEMIGQNRKAFKEPYALFCRIADSEDDADAKQKHDDNVLFLAKQRRAFNALTAGKQLDWVNLIQDSEEIEKLREDAEREAAEAAAEAAEDAVETPADT